MGATYEEMVQNADAMVAHLQATDLKLDELRALIVSLRDSQPGGSVTLTQEQIDDIANRLGAMRFQSEAIAQEAEAADD